MDIFNEETTSASLIKTPGVHNDSLQEFSLNEHHEVNDWLSGFCREPFWDRSRSWDTTSPDPGSCFERTVLVWVPCGFLWICAPLYILILKLRPHNPIPWSALSYTKMLLSLLLIVTAATELIWLALKYPAAATSSDILASLILLLSHILHIFLVHLGRLRGERISWVLWIYWCLLVFCGIPQMITTVLAVFFLTTELPVVLAVTFTLHYIGSLTLFMANCLCDQPSKLEAISASQFQSPELSASLPSRLMYWWNFPFIWQGWKRPIVIEDLWDLHPDNGAKIAAKQWKAKFEKMSESKHKGENAAGKEKGKKEVYLVRKMWRMSRSTFIYCFFLYFAAEMTRFLTPPLLSLLIQLVNDSTEPSWHGYLYAASLLIVCEFSSVLKNKYFYDMVNCGLRIRSALMSAVYLKALRLSVSARRESTIGQIVNLMAVDATIIGDTCWQVCNLIGAPLIILVAAGFLWQKLGSAVLAGLAILILLTPINSYITNKTKQCQLSCMKLRDRRVKMISEIISGIKVLKLYAWEESFANQVNSVRDEEIHYLRKIAFLQAFSAFVFQVSPYLVALATFTTYLLASEDNVLNAELAFVSISLFNLMKLPMTQMPNVIAQIIQAYVALQRMKTFLSSSELDQMAICSDRSQSCHLAIQNGDFTWEGSDSENNWCVKDVNLEVQRGKLVAIVGSVGAGKSSLISALLGEMKKEAGQVYVNGNVSYVSQQAWLQNATLRDNILWGQSYDDHWYQEVIQACALEPDLDMLPAGDMTEIGEKGINLSGGQKQRIALARAVYREAEIVMLDDPLSAVDAHVGKHIFENVIGPNGLLKSKTRLLVTHAVTFLPQVDEVFLMKEGRLVEKGTYAELVSADREFAQFVVQYITSLKDPDAEEEILEICDQLEGSRKELLLRQISQISSSASAQSDVCHDSNRRSSGGRQRSVSESVQSQTHEKNAHNTLLSFHMHQRNGSLPFTIERKRLNIFEGVGALKKSNNAIRISGSKSAIHSTSHDKLTEMTLLNVTGNRGESVKSPLNNDQTGLVDEELAETGKVARYVYLIYGEAMGLVFVITSIVALSLGQASVAGSNVWLSLWSTSSESVESEVLNATASDSYFDNSTSENVISRDIFIAGYGIFGIAQAFFIFAGMTLIMLGCLRASSSLHQDLLGSVIRLPMSFFDTNPSGRIMNRFSKEIHVLDNILPMTVRSFISFFTQVIATLIVIVASTPMAALFMVPITAVYYFIQIIFVATSRQLKRIESISKSPIYSHFSETIQGVSVIRAFKKQDEFFEVSLAKIDHFLKVMFINVSTNRWVAVHLETLGNLITFAAAILAVLARDTISPGIVGLSVTYALSVTMVLNWLVRIASDLEANIVSVERINEYLQKEEEADWRMNGHMLSQSWPEHGKVTFNNYEMRYRPGLELVLKGITCTINPGEKVGIVGRTGAGKSSLTLALFRLVEAAGGNIEIDGVKIANIGLHDLRSQISIIPQDPVLFSGTLRQNLDPFETSNDADIWRALELAHLSDYVKYQPLGLQHPVDEDGSNFSVGQRQLVCLARALLRQSKILVLDEATAAVDLETDDLIQATIRDQFKHCTVVTIAHRLNTIMDYDRVLVLDQGHIAEFDTPEALTANAESIFRGMAKDAGLI